MLHILFYVICVFVFGPFLQQQIRFSHVLSLLCQFGVVVLSVCDLLFICLRAPMGRRRPTQ